MYIYCMAKQEESRVKEIRGSPGEIQICHLDVTSNSNSSERGLQ